jgi:putative ABC transport system ATP-binding protein
MTYAVELRKVGKSFLEGRGPGARERVVLDGVDLALEAGQAAALLGRSGSGKSTLLNLLGGLDLPGRGEVRIAGESLAGLSERDRTRFRRRHVGFVFQSYNLVPTLTVEENLLLPLELKDGVTAEGRRRALGLLAEVGLADRAGAFPDVLSGGEQQRVAVARALSHDPALVLADEPTGNLDAESGAQVMALLEGLVRRSGKTLVLVTHSPELAAFADRFFRLQGGTLSETPRPAATAP